MNTEGLYPLNYNEIIIATHFLSSQQITRHENYYVFSNLAVQKLSTIVSTCTSSFTKTLLSNTRKFTFKLPGEKTFLQ